MTHIFAWIDQHLYSFMVPVCLLCVLRIAVCFLELGRIRHLREKKHRFLSSARQITEIGCELGVLLGGILTCLLPDFWIVTIPAAVVLGVVGRGIAAKRARASDDFWRAVAREMQTPDGGAEDAGASALSESGIGGVINAVSDYGSDEEQKESES